MITHPESDGQSEAGKNMLEGLGMYFGGKPSRQKSGGIGPEGKRGVEGLKVPT